MKNWVETKLGDCIHFTNGYAFKSNQFTSDINDVPLIKGENVGKGKILWAESKYWKREDLPQLEKFILKPNDIVLAMDRPWVSGSLKYALITKDDPISLLVQRVGCLRAKSNIYFSFLKHIIGSEPFAMYIKNIMSGVAVPHISPKQIQAFTFNLPPLPIQRKIAETLTASMI